MNLNYSDAQIILREQVLKFCETNYDFIDREKILESDSGFSKDNWQQFAELGWLAVPFKEENGGFNFGPATCSYTNRANTGDVFLHSYDWRMTENPSNLANELQYITD